MQYECFFFFKYLLMAFEDAVNNTTHSHYTPMFVPLENNTL